MIQAAGSGVSLDRLTELLAPYLPPGAEVPEGMFGQLQAYLDLLLRWNARTNLTAIRDPEAIILRHFGESLFAGVALQARVGHGATLLDVGSGAGFPGLPIQLLRPDLRVTLAESQGKKAAFLREAVRVLGVHTEVFAARIETMSGERRFDAVTLRAVDRMESAVGAAWERTGESGWLAILGDAPEALRSDAICLGMPGKTGAGLALIQRKLD